MKTLGVLSLVTALISLAYNFGKISREVEVLVLNKELALCGEEHQVALKMLSKWRPQDKVIIYQEE